MNISIGKVATLALAISTLMATAPANARGLFDDVFHAAAVQAGRLPTVCFQAPCKMPQVPTKRVCGCFSCWEEPLAIPSSAFSCNAPANGEQAQFCQQLTAQTGVVF
jgi:hypothetical protein